MLVLVALWLLGLVSVAGLVVDGGLVLAERRDLQNVTDAAAAAAAMQLDETAYRVSNGAVVMLDPAAARGSALAYLASEPGLNYTVSATASRVAIATQREAELSFLRMVGIGSVAVSAQASAVPRYGVLAGSP